MQLYYIGYDFRVTVLLVCTSPLGLLLFSVTTAVGETVSYILTDNSRILSDVLWPPILSYSTKTILLISKCSLLYHTVQV